MNKSHSIYQRLSFQGEGRTDQSHSHTHTHKKEREREHHPIITLGVIIIWEKSLGGGGTCQIAHLFCDQKKREIQFLVLTIIALSLLVIFFVPKGVVDSLSASAREEKEQKLRRKRGERKIVLLSGQCCQIDCSTNWDITLERLDNDFLKTLHYCFRCFFC